MDTRVVFSLLWKSFTNDITSCYLTFKVTHSELYKYTYPDGIEIFICLSFFISFLSLSIFGLGLRFNKTKNFDQNWKLFHYFGVMLLSFAFFFSSEMPRRSI